MLNYRRLEKVYIINKLVLTFVFQLLRYLRTIFENYTQSLKVNLIVLTKLVLSYYKQSLFEIFLILKY